MSSEPEKSPAPGNPEEQQLSKKAEKKEAAKLEKLRRRQEAEAASAALEEASIDDPLSSKYGDMPFQDVRSKVSAGRSWTPVHELDAEMKNKAVLIRGRAQVIRAVSKKMAFVVVRESGYTIQCILSVSPERVSPQMVKFATGISRESIIVVDGVVSVPSGPIKATTQQVEIQVQRIYALSRALPTLPINIEDASRSDLEIEQALQAGEQLVRVNQDTRLKYRVLDLRTAANQAIFRVQCAVEDEFRRFLKSENFVGIHTPKLISGSSEGGAAVFKLDYMGQPGCLAQSPQLYKQMTICGDMKRVYEVGAVYRAERSSTNRHLCEFIGLDVEMEILEHYSEVMDIVDRLFVSMFDHLNSNCAKELEAIRRQYPFEPLRYLRKTLQLTFQEGVEMLKEAGVKVDLSRDLSAFNNETERKLGQLVLEKYGTEFYILHQYPLAVRPFYTMPSYENSNYSNSFDVFIRGEEIISGAQRVHDADFLAQRAEALRIDVKTIADYIDSFRFGAPPHGGFGVGLERVVMLFCGLNNIRKTSLYPRDRQRITP